jgi:uncharacterized protein (TIGR03435 family)
VRILFLLAIAAACRAQSPEFEVASIKPTRSGVTERSFTPSPGGRLTTSNATVKSLIAFAYQVMPEEIVGGPAWLETDGFDIEAKAPDPKVTPAQFRQMIQSLLARRFRLAIHRDAREGSVYALVQAKNGSKLVEARDDNAEVSMRIEGPGQMTGVKATMPMLANTLSRPLRRKVIDETGLKGSYSFTLRFAPEAKPGRPESAPETDVPTIFNALREQLGLMLKPGKGPVDVFVVDHAEKPAAN